MHWRAVFLAVGLWLAGWAALLSIAALTDNSSTTTTSPRPQATAEPHPSATPDRRCSSEDYVQGFEDIRNPLEMFADAYDRATASARLTISQPIADMQQARRDFMAADLPDCFARYQRLQGAAYTQFIDAMLAFQRDDQAWLAQAAAAAETLDRASAELETIIP